MLATATALLDRHAAAINALNVFPVPDGDTGTNMLLTMQAALQEIGNAEGHTVAAVAQAAAYGALMGARGNSGVILSQLFRGMANSLESKESFGPPDFAQAMVEASNMAYKGVIQPVEGTMLTVSREAAQAALRSAQEGNDLLLVWEDTVKAAKESVAHTPALLDVLREAGVVDAGGEGLFVILDGALRHLKGEAIEMAETVETTMPKASGPPEMEWGYCTEFILEGRGLDLEEMRKVIASLGQSALAVGDDRLIKVHVHTFDPGAVLGYASSKGVLRDIKIDNMQEQHREYLIMGQEAAQAAQETEGIAIVAVVSGPGLIRVFESLGADGIVPGGQTMNPSTQEILEAVDSLPIRKVIVLPNNENILLAAERAQELSRKEVTIVPTVTIPQGVGALLAFNRKADLESNVQAMGKALAGIRTAEITTAIRPAKINSIRVRMGQLISIIEGQLTIAGETIEEVVQESLKKMGAQDGEIITLYHGDSVSPPQAQALAQKIRQRYPEKEVECVDGGQPHYHYIISVE